MDKILRGMWVLSSFASPQRRLANQGSYITDFSLQLMPLDLLHSGCMTERTYYWQVGCFIYVK